MSAAACWGQWRQESYAIGEMSQVGEVRRAVERLAQAAGFGETARGRAAIIASELATNIVRHAGKPGEVLVQVLDPDGEAQLELLAIDRGVGMDVGRCMQDGYSTGGTHGNGLGAVSRLASVFDVYSVEGAGTVLMARIGREAPPQGAGRSPSSSTIQVGAVSRALEGEIENGDTWRVSASCDRLAMLVVDGLGHGPLAASASTAAAECFLRQPFADPVESLSSIHRALGGSRGAAGSCVVVDLGTRSAAVAGVGNISVSYHSEGVRKSIGGHNGTLGVIPSRPRAFHYTLPPDSLLLLSSDGLKTRWSLDQYPGLAHRHPATIAGVLYALHARQMDDVTVVAVRVP